MLVTLTLLLKLLEATAQLHIRAANGQEAETEEKHGNNYLFRNAHEGGILHQILLNVTILNLVGNIVDKAHSRRVSSGVALNRFSVWFAESLGIEPTHLSIVHNFLDVLVLSITRSLDGMHLIFVANGAGEMGQPQQLKLAGSVAVFDNVDLGGVISHIANIFYFSRVLEPLIL